jgi:hypothetical protein
MAIDQNLPGPQQLPHMQSVMLSVNWPAFADGLNYPGMPQIVRTRWLDLAALSLLENNAVFLSMDAIV